MTRGESRQAAGVAIFDTNGRLLLGLHEHDSRWATLGGSVESRETAEDAARREAHEEVGLQLAQIHPLGQFGGSDIYDVTYANGEVQRYDVTMYACILGEALAVPDGREILDLAWVAQRDIPAYQLARDMAEIVPAAYVWFATHHHKH